MASSIYNHKHLQPAGASSQGGPSQQPQYNHAKLNDCFEVIRNEFDILAQEMGVSRSQRDDFDSKLTHQVNELTIIRQSLYELETQHTKIRAQYEEEIRNLRLEVQTLRTQQNGPPLPREGIASLGRDRDRDRDLRDRERELAAARGEAAGRDALGIGRPLSLQSQSVPSQGPGEPLGALALAPHAGPIGLGVATGPPSAGPGPSAYADPFYGRPERERQIERERERERERNELRDRDRDRDRERDRMDRERDRERDGREVKRIKTEGRNKIDRAGKPTTITI